MTGPENDAVAELVVSESLVGERIDRIVTMITALSRSQAQQMIEAGDVKLDGKTPAKPAVRVELDQQVHILRLPEPDVIEPDPSVHIPVIHVDEAVLVVDKPSGLVVHPGAGVSTGTMVHGLLAQFPEIEGVGPADRPGVVHRLDRGTSGLLVVARTEEARLDLVDQLTSRTVTRVYRALVRGIPTTPEGLVDAPIGRSIRQPPRQTISATGREARTHYRVMQRFHESNLSLLEGRLETGRTHQIRVHMEVIGHHVVGDDRYGIKGPKFGLTRPFLHAVELGFDHPVSGDAVHFESPLPADLTDVLAKLR